MLLGMAILVTWGMSVSIGYVLTDQVNELKDRQHRILDVIVTTTVNNSYYDCVQGEEDNTTLVELCEQVRYLTIKEIYKQVNNLD